MATQEFHDEVTKLPSEHWEMSWANSYLRPYQTSMMEFFAKIAHSFSASEGNTGTALYEGNTGT